MNPEFVEFHGDDCDKLDSLLSQRIYEFNSAVLDCHDCRLFGYAMRNPLGQTVAGASGHTWTGFCDISYLWISESLRGQGVGRELMQTVEAEAARRKCSIVFLFTQSSESSRFYERVG